MHEMTLPPMGTLIGDPLPGAPALAARGGLPTGVRTIQLIHPEQPDVPASLAEGRLVRRDRPLTVEVWYPAAPRGGERHAVYQEVMGRADWNNLEPFTFEGRALRDAAPDVAGGPYPVVVISHGYPGSRMLLSNLSENLCGKGYVVMNIAHTDNTYEDFRPQGSMESALIQRTLDQRFVIGMLPELNRAGWLEGMLTPERVGLIGFSMGGYGLLRTLGAQAGENARKLCGALAELLCDPEGFRGLEAVRAAVAFAPATFFLDEATAARIGVPTLWVCGSADKTVGYDAVHAFCEKATGSDRTFLTFENCGHNVANNPAPSQAAGRDWTIMKRWADPVWDTRRLNDVNCHFVTAFMDLHLKGMADRKRFFDVPVRRGSDAVWRVDASGTPAQGHTYWPGFVEGNAAGLMLEQLSAEREGMSEEAGA